MTLFAVVAVQSLVEGEIKWSNGRTRPAKANEPGGDRQEGKDVTQSQIDR